MATTSEYNPVLPSPAASVLVDSEVSSTSHPRLSTLPLLLGVITGPTVIIVVIVVLILFVLYTRQKRRNGVLRRTRRPANTTNYSSKSVSTPAVLQPLRPTSLLPVFSSPISCTSIEAIRYSVQEQGNRNSYKDAGRRNGRALSAHFIPSRSSSMLSLVKLECSPELWQSNPTYSSTESCSIPVNPAVGRYETSSLLQLDSFTGNEFLNSYVSSCEDSILLSLPANPLEVIHDNIQEIGELGVGQFGQVVLAETVGLSLKDLQLSDTDDDRRSVSVLVAVKKLKPDAGEGVQLGFLREIRVMSHLTHKNIVRLLGVCSGSNPFIVMEYMENGDLNQYLCRRCFASLKTPISETQISRPVLLYMASQIASGMKYLSSLRLIHRDLATRNCLVGAQNIVKIADFGLSRNLYSSHYYQLKGKAVLPIRWMATECFYGIFSEKSDIWAFGITMWEIFTLAKKQPYEDMSNQDLIDDAIQGPKRKLLLQPKHCPPEAYALMLQCWVYYPEDRPAFEELHTSLEILCAKST